MRRRLVNEWNPKPLCGCPKSVNRGQSFYTSHLEPALILLTSVPRFCSDMLHQYDAMPFIHVVKLFL